MSDQQSRELAQLDQAVRMLAEADSLPEIRAIRDQAETVRAYAKTAKAGLELQNRAAEIKLRSERKAGQYLASLNLRGGDRKSKSHDATLKLEALGINKSQSQRWQAEAAIPGDLFERYIQGTKDVCKEISSAGLLNIARKAMSPRPVQPRKHSESDVLNGAISQPSSNSETYNVVTELQNHLQLLSITLATACGDGGKVLELVERRTVCRLIREMDALLQELSCPSQKIDLRS